MILPHISNMALYLLSIAVAPKWLNTQKCRDMCNGGIPLDFRWEKNDTTRAQPRLVDNVSCPLGGFWRRFIYLDMRVHNRCRLPRSAGYQELNPGGIGRAVMFLVVLLCLELCGK
jgi:hypothetical protein